MTLSRAFKILILLMMRGVAFARAADDAPAPPIEIHHAAGLITIDGVLSDEGWKGASRVDTWYEVQPGDNTPPKVKNVGYLTYDDKFFYAAFEFQDPEPAKIR